MVPLSGLFLVGGGVEAAVGVLAAGASPQSGVFSARQGVSRNKPELCCEGGDKQRSGRGLAALFPLPFVIPSSAPSVLFLDLFRRRENAPFTYPARTKSGRGELAAPPGQYSQSQPKGAERADGDRRLARGGFPAQ